MTNEASHKLGLHQCGTLFSRRSVSYAYQFILTIVIFPLFLKCCNKTVRDTGKLLGFASFSLLSGIWDMLSFSGFHIFMNPGEKR